MVGWWPGHHQGHGQGDGRPLLDRRGPRTRGAEAPFHLHRKEDEAFYVLEGEMTFHIGERR